MLEVYTITSVYDTTSISQTRTINMSLSSIKEDLSWNLKESLMAINNPAFFLAAEAVNVCEKCFNESFGGTCLRKWVSCKNIMSPWRDRLSFLQGLLLMWAVKAPYVE